MPVVLQEEAYPRRVHVAQDCGAHPLPLSHVCPQLLCIVFGLLVWLVYGWVSSKCHESSWCMVASIAVDATPVCPRAGHTQVPATGGVRREETSHPPHQRSVWK